MNSTPANSKARRTARLLAAVMDVSPAAKATGTRANNFGFVSQKAQKDIKCYASIPIDGQIKRSNCPGWFATWSA
jgi:hypothetical protein